MVIWCDAGLNYICLLCHGSGLFGQEKNDAVSKAASYVHLCDLPKMRDNDGQPPEATRYASFTLINMQVSVRNVILIGTQVQVLMCCLK